MRPGGRARGWTQDELEDEAFMGREYERTGQCSVVYKEEGRQNERKTERQKARSGVGRAREATWSCQRFGGPDVEVEG